MSKTGHILQFAMELAVERSREEMQSFLDKMSVPEYGPVTCKVENNELPQKRPCFEDEMSFRPQIHTITSLEKLQQDVTLIRTNLEKKRAKVTLNQLNEKVDLILTILQSWNVSTQ